MLLATGRFIFVLLIMLSHKWTLSHGTHSYHSRP